MESQNLKSRNGDIEMNVKPLYMHLDSKMPTYGEKVIVLLNNEEKEAIFSEYMNGTCSCFFVDGKPEHTIKKWRY